MLDPAPLILSLVGLPDVPTAVGQYRFLESKGWAKDTRLLLVADFDLSSYDVWKLLSAAKLAFQSVQVVQPPFHVERSGELCWENWMIQTAVIRNLKRRDEPITILPLDAMPLRPEWMRHITIGNKTIPARPAPMTQSCFHWMKIAGHHNKPWWYRMKVKGVEMLKDDGKIGPVESYHPSTGFLIGAPVATYFKSLAVSAPASTAPSSRRLVMRRWAAIGDVIASTAVAKALVEQGISVDLVTFQPCSEAIIHSPFITSVSENATSDFNLDLAYENDPRKATHHIHELYFDSANRQLARLGISIAKPVNAAPLLSVSSLEVEFAQKKMSEYARPWIVVCPRSNMAARSIPAHVVQGAASVLPGTVFWCSDAPGPSNTVDLKVKRLRDLMAYIQCGDLIVSVDSAPLHIAAGLKKPVLAIRQSFDPFLRISEQRDMTVFNRTDLKCIPCTKYVCPLDKDDPPCGHLPLSDFVSEIKQKLASLFGNTVSAIIPVLKPDVTRLNRCLAAILPQVQQVVIGIDGDGARPAGVMASPKIKFVQNHSKVRRGYGKTCNLAASQSFGKYLMMLNDDCFVNPEIIRVMKLEMDLDTKCAVVGGLLRYPDGRIQHGGTVRHGINFGHLDHLQTKPTITMPTSMEFVTFAAAMVKREAFYSVDGFDERFDCYGEDSDICLRLARAGWKVRYNPNAKGIHQESQTTSANKLALLKAGNAVFESIWKNR